MMSTASQESLSAAYASAYDYGDAPAPAPAQQHQPHYQNQHQQHKQQPHQQHTQYYQQHQPNQSHQASPPPRQQLHHSSSAASASGSISGSNSGPSLSRAGGSVGSSGSQSYYSSAQQQPSSHHQPHYQHRHYSQQEQRQQQQYSTPYHQPHQSAAPVSAGYAERAFAHNVPSTNSSSNHHNSSAAYPVPAPPIPSNMYAQSNISMPALAPTSAGGAPGYMAPPLADDLGESFANMRLMGTPTFGPQRVKSPAPGLASSSASSSPSATNTKSAVPSAASVRANAMYANQEIHQSAAEVHPENSLAAIADQVDQAAAGFDSQPTNSSQNANGSLAGGGPDWSPQNTSGSGARSIADSNFNAVSAAPGYPGQQSYYGSGVRQHSAPGEYPPGSFPASMDGQAVSSSAAQNMAWDPNAAASAYYPDGSHPGGATNYPSAPFSGFQAHAAHHTGGAYPFAAGPGAVNGGGAPGGYEANPYFAAASGYLGFPDTSAPSFPPGADMYGGPAGMMPMGPGAIAAGGGRPNMLSRQGTQMSMMSGTSGGLSGLSANPRRKSKDAAPQQTLPFNKSFVAEYRQRMKGDPDPEAQFAYAKYLIEAAKKVHDPADGPKQQRKYRDTLLSESLKLIKRLATTGMGLGKPPFAEAQFFLANCFGNGSLGLQVDHEKAYNLYVQASKQNHPAATYRTAVCNEVGAGTRRDHHRAVLFYRKASALGDTAGMYKLGMVLLNGMLGQPRNVREAIVWLKRAAAQADEDNPHALHELGLLHEKINNGVVLHDEAYARELFTQAAQLGYAPSQFKLGSAYEYGNLTCPVDPRRSIAWYTKAAQKGDGESELALSGWYLTGSEGVLKQSDSEAYLWARRAASKGIPKAEYAVGYYSEVGIGVESNLEEAKRWYMRAAAQGNKRAMQRLTELKKMKATGALTGGKKGARPTRKDAESECTIM